MRAAPPARRSGWASNGAINAGPGIDMPPPPPPMLTLSLPSVARATVQPPSTGPTTSSSGTNTSLKKTSLNSESPVVIFSGTHLDALGVHVDDHHGDAVVLGHVGVGAHGGEAHAGDVGAGRPHLLAVDQPAAVDPGGLGLDARRVGAGVGLAEELAPDDVLGERGMHPAVDLVLGGVLDEREDDPARDPVGGTRDARLAELLLDHELLDRAGGSAVRLRPVRHHVAGLDEAGALFVGRQVLDALRERADLLADGLGLGRQLDGLLADDPAAGQIGDVVGGTVRRRR